METVVHAASLRPRVEIASRTDPGRDPDKQVNEDAYAYRPTPFGHLLVVCDGMGGHNAGEVASQLALETIIKTVESAPLDTPPRALLTHAIRAANERVYGLAVPDTVGRPGSTIVLALIQAAGAVVGHVGDSRCYLLRQGQALALTKDHSVVQQMVDQGLITAEQAVGHPDANRILRALGVAAAVDIDVRGDTVPFGSGDAFLLCSDGLTDLVSGQEIARVFQEAGTPERAASLLVDLANERGGHDNITVLIARVHDDATASVTPTIIATQPDNVPPAPPGSGGTLRPAAQAPHGLVTGPNPMMPVPHPSSGATQPGLQVHPQHPQHDYGGGPQTYPHPHPNAPPQSQPYGRAMPEPPYSRPSIPPSRPRVPHSDRGLLFAGLLLGLLGIVVIAGIAFVLWSRSHPKTRTPTFVDASAPMVGPGVPDAAILVPENVAPAQDPAPLPSLLPTPQPAPTSSTPDAPRVLPNRGRPRPTTPPF